MNNGKSLMINTINIEVRPFEESIKDFVRVWEDISKGKPVKKIRRIAFEDIETLRSILTPQRIRLMHSIRVNHPGSIYELAKMTDRKWRAVANDIEILSNVGLVKLEKKEKPREIVKPIVNFSRMNISISV